MEIEQEPEENSGHNTAKKNDTANENKYKMDKTDASYYPDFWTIHTACSFAYLPALIAFGIMFNVDKLPLLPYPIVGNLLDPHILEGTSDSWEEGVVVVALMFMMSYVRRIILIMIEECYRYRLILEKIDAKAKKESDREVKENGHRGPRNERTKNKPSFCRQFGAALMYHMVFAIWLGWACNGNVAYLTSDMPYIIIGLLVHVVGEALCYSTLYARMSYLSWYWELQEWRVAAELGDIVSLIGIAVYTVSLPACFYTCLRLLLSILGCLTPVIDLRLF